MSRQVICASNRITGCQNIISQKGHIFCEKCNEERKSSTKFRRDQDIEDLVNKNLELEKQLIYIRENQIETENKLQKITNESCEKISNLELEIKSLQTQKNELEKTNLGLITENHLLQNSNQEFLSSNKKIKEINIELENIISDFKKEEENNSKNITIYKSQFEKENSILQELV